MKKLLKKVSFTGVLILFGIPLLVNASISYECRYDQSSIQFEKREGGDLIRLKDIGVIENEGKPMMPVDYIHLLIPQGQKAESVKVEINSSYTLPGRYKINPSPNPINPSEHPMDLSIYNSEVPYPGVRAKITRTGSFGGNKIVQIAVYPMDYFPKKGEIVFFTDLTIELFHGDSKREAIKQTYRTSYSDYKINKALKSIVDNDYDIPSYSYHPNTKDKDVYSYIIITGRDLTESFELLIEHLWRKGIEARTFSVEEILEEYREDPISKISDEAGAIRGFLMDMYKEGVQWVLLGGHEKVVPVRYGCAKDNDHSVQQKQPSDLYYSDLDGNWNVDEDKYYGEPNDDAIDCYPELFVGRLPCDNNDEIEHWTKKLLSYEDPKSTAYLTRVFWTAADEVRNAPRNIIEYGSFPSYFSHDTTMLEGTDGYGPKGSAVIDVMNEHFGWFNHYGHGAPDQLTVSAPGNNNPSPYRDFIVSLDSCDEYFYAHSPTCNVEPGNGLDSLHNQNYYGIMYLSSCYQGAYDHEHFDLFDNYCGPSMAEAFTLLPKKGGPAFLGYTRYATYIAPQILHIRLLDMLFNEQLTNIGVAEALSKTQVCNHYIHLGHTLFGCPLMEVWTEEPKTLNVIVDNSVPPEAMDFNIRVTSNGKSVDDAYVCLWKDDEVYTTGFSTRNGKLTVPIEPKTEGEMFLTVTKENFLSYRDTIYITKSASITEGTSIAYATCKTEGTLLLNKVIFELYLSETGQVKLDIFDVTGREVAKLKDGVFEKGSHRITWAGFDANGGCTPKGIYFFRLQYKNQTLRGKFLLLR
ncbi:hypothetical protein KAW18_06870 [candidate division WOR-3 bacterium]|nr:hypothetical protein [candidate division WOR-3 bacterium]